MSSSAGCQRQCLATTLHMPTSGEPIHKASCSFAGVMKKTEQSRGSSLGRIPSIPCSPCGALARRSCTHIVSVAKRWERTRLSFTWFGQGLQDAHLSRWWTGTSLCAAPAEERGTQLIAQFKPPPPRLTRTSRNWFRSWLSHFMPTSWHLVLRQSSTGRDRADARTSRRCPTAPDLDPEVTNGWQMSSRSDLPSKTPRRAGSRLAGQYMNSEIPPSRSSFSAGRSKDLDRGNRWRRSRTPWYHGH